MKTSPKLHFNSATGERVDSLIGFTGKAILILTLLNMGFWFPWFFQTLSGLLSAKLELSFANRDFVNYWLAGRLILSGDVSTLFSQATHQAALELATGLQGMEIRNWSYPPHFLLLLGWLGWLPYQAAYFLFQILTLIFFLTASHHAMNNWQGSNYTALALVNKKSILVAICLLPFVILQFTAGQNGFWFAGLMIIVLTYRQDKPIIAAFFLALLTMKPQLGLLFPLLMLIEKRYVLIGWTILFTIIFLALSILFFGIENWSRFFTEVIGYQKIVAMEWQGLFLLLMPTWFAGFRAMGLDSNLALNLHMAIVFVLAAFLVWRMIVSKTDSYRTILLVAGTFVVSPYAFSYDMGPLFLYTAFVSLQFLPNILEIGKITKSHPVGWIGSKGVSFFYASIFALPLWTPMLFVPNGYNYLTCLYLMPPLLLSINLFWILRWGKLPI